MDTALAVTRVCEAWWDRVRQSRKEELPRFAEQLLETLGWSPPLPYSARERASALGARPYLLHYGQTLGVAYFCGPGLLEPPSLILERGLDFCPATHALLCEAAELRVPYALVTDLYRWYLYDVRTRELLLRADEPRELNEEWVTALQCQSAASGSLDALRREPRSAQARRLRDWREGWVRHLRLEGGVPEEIGGPAMDRFIVLRALLDGDALHGDVGLLRARWEELTQIAQRTRPRGCGGALNFLLRDMWTRWRIEQFAPCHELEQALTDDNLAAALVRELALLAPSKFSLDAVLESFNYGSAQDKLLVRTVPDFNEDREQYLRRVDPETVSSAYVEVDLSEEGYRSVLFWFHRLIDLYARLGLAPGWPEDDGTTTPDAEVDLLAWSALEEVRPTLNADPFVRACAQGFGVVCHSEHQRRVVKMLLTLYLIELYTERANKACVFPSVEQVVSVPSRHGQRTGLRAAGGSEYTRDSPYSLPQVNRTRRRMVGLIEDLGGFR